MIESMQSKMMIEKYMSSLTRPSATSSKVTSNISASHRLLRGSAERKNHPGPRVGVELSVFSKSSSELSCKWKGFEPSNSVKDNRCIQQINDLVNNDFRSLRRTLQNRKSSDERSR